VSINLTDTFFTIELSDLDGNSYIG